MSTTMEKIKELRADLEKTAKYSKELKTEYQNKNEREQAAYNAGITDTLRLVSEWIDNDILLV